MADQDPPAQPTAAAPAKPERTCRCGYAIGHPQVSPEPRYGFGGWLLLLLGATPKPRHAIFKCHRCGTVLGYTRDERILKEFS